MNKTEKMKKTLIKMLKDNKEMISNPTTLEAYLLDYVPDLKKETFLVVTSAKAGIDDIFSDKPMSPIEYNASVDALKKKLSADYSFSQDVIDWITSLWESVYQSLANKENKSTDSPCDSEDREVQNNQSYKELRTQYLTLQKEYEVLKKQQEIQKKSNNKDSNVKIENVPFLNEKPQNHQDIPNSESMMKTKQQENNNNSKNSVELYEAITSIVILIVIFIVIVILIIGSFFGC